MQYTFRSNSGRTVTVEGDIHEQRARKVAMYYLWGPPKEAWCKNEGTGLTLIDQPANSHIVRI